MFGPVSEGMRLFKSGVKIAVVGYSEAPHRVVVKVSRYLLEEGNQIIGINPKLARAEKMDIPIVATLADLAEPVDIIQVFRKSAALPELGREVLALGWKPQMIWCQQGVIDILFGEEMEQHGISVVMDACPYALRSFL